MSPASEKLVTLEEFYSLPDDGLFYELSRGRLISEPPAGDRHGRIVSQIATALTNYAIKRRLGVVLTGDVGFLLASDPVTVRAPDVSFIAAQRYLALSQNSAYFPGPPDLAVEVLSPGDRPGKVAAKLSDYFAAGTPLVWMIDGEAETVCIHEPGITPVVLGASDFLSATDLLPGFRVCVGELFRIYC